MVYDKIKYVFRQDSSSKWVEEQIKKFKENPDDPSLAELTRHCNLTIISINDDGSYIRYKKDGYNMTRGLNMEYYLHTAVVMEDGTIFYDLGENGPDKKAIQAAFYDYCINGKIPEWTVSENDYVELDDIVL